MEWQEIALYFLTALAAAAATQLVKLPGRYDRSVRERLRTEISREQAERTVAAKEAELTTAHALIAELREEVFRLERRIFQLGGEGVAK